MTIKATYVKILLMKKRVFSGVQPSGNLHIGNYLGAILTWVREQDKKENIFCIVDEHAITVPQNPKELQKRTLEIAKIYLAAGIDPKKSNIFVQSDRPEHAELGWIINCHAYMGELSRMTQYKVKRGETKYQTVNNHFKNNKVLTKKEFEKIDKKIFNDTSVGLFDYPALMAADILLYDTDEVPVGEDQKQHIEFTRDVAERMNNRYGKIFTVPSYYTVKEATRIMSLQDPTIKMSKSDENENSRIELLDSPEIIKKKFAKAVTDSKNKVKFDMKNQPGISNLLNIMAVCKNTSVSELEKKYKDISYGEFKNDVAESVIELLLPFQKRFYKLNDKEVDKILKDGAKNVANKAQSTLKRVKDAIGLGS